MKNQNTGRTNNVNNDNDDDWKAIVKFWRESQKYREMKKKLNNNSNNISLMSEEEIIRTCENIIEFDKLSDEERETLDFLELSLISLKTEDELIESLATTLVRWYWHEALYVDVEKYETACKIRDVAKIEISEANRIIETYFPEADMDDYKIIFDELNKTTRDMSYKAYKDIKRSIIIN